MKSIVRIKLIFAFALVAVFLSLAGCGGPVDTIKAGVLTSYPQTTVGNAFDAAFDDVRWEAKETANKTKFVELTGKTKKGMQVAEDGVLIIPQGSKVTVQFTINEDKSFRISFVQAPIKLVEEDFRAALFKIVAIGKKIKFDGITPVDFSDLQIKEGNIVMDTFLDNIYNPK